MSNVIKMMGLIIVLLSTSLFSFFIDFNNYQNINYQNINYTTSRSFDNKKNIDSLIINENELRHEMRDKIGNLEKMGIKLMKFLKINKLIITRGNRGVILVEKKGKTTYAPAFANKVVDKVGAGDTMLAMISLCMKIKMPGDLSLFLGSLAGATAVENIVTSPYITTPHTVQLLELTLTCVPTSD